MSEQNGNGAGTQTNLQSEQGKARAKANQMFSSFGLRVGRSCQKEEENQRKALESARTHVAEMECKCDATAAIRPSTSLQDALCLHQQRRAANNLLSINHRFRMWDISQSPVSRLRPKGR
eukprot:3437572-Amphidinium_carterae.1